MKGKSRPVGILVVSVLIALSGLGAIVTAIPTMSAGVSTLGILLDLAFALMMLYIAWGVFTLKPWAWSTAIVVHALSAVLALISLAGLGTFPGGWIAAIVSIGVIVYLTRPRVRAAFGRAAAPADRII